MKYFRYRISTYFDHKKFRSGIALPRPADAKWNAIWYSTKFAICDNEELSASGLNYIANVQKEHLGMAQRTLLEFLDEFVETVESSVDTTHISSKAMVNFFQDYYKLELVENEAV